MIPNSPTETVKCQFCGEPATKLRYKPEWFEGIAYDLCDNCADKHNRAFAIPMTTNPPTESRECNCIDCRVGRDLGLKPKVEPTVEKIMQEMKKYMHQCGIFRMEPREEQFMEILTPILSHITEPTHSLISKIPSAYGVGSANLPEGDNWERKFDEAFEGTMCDGTGVDYGDTQREVKDFIRTLLSHSVQEAKAEER